MNEKGTIARQNYHQHAGHGEFRGLGAHFDEGGGEQVC
jgi:hypothetical protein